MNNDTQEKSAHSIRDSYKLPNLLKWVVAALFILLINTIIIVSGTHYLISQFYGLYHDAPIIGLTIITLMILIYTKCGISYNPKSPHPVKILIVAIGLILTVRTAGRYILLDYPLTRDEHMVVFDMLVFSRGYLAMPLAIEWRDFAIAMVPAFLMDIPGYSFWVSAYMPVNAMLRAGFATVADPVFLNPLFAAIGLLAIVDIAKKLFPKEAATQWVAVIFYLTSIQMIVNAGTVYAMTGHLAFNLVWLALYIRRSRWCHLLALCVGFLAIGLHQVIFHPIFVAPFIMYSIIQRHYTKAYCYILFYAIFGIFWISYPQIALAISGSAPDIGGAAASDSFIKDRLLPLITDRDPRTFQLMTLNIVRFISWQNLVLVPMLILAWPATRNRASLAAPLFGGIGLALLVFGILLPYQGNGWGYRYLHGFIGSAALLAAYGYSLARPRFGDRLNGIVIAGSVVTVTVAFPFLLWRSHEFVKPYQALEQRIESATANFIILDTEPPALPIDVVRNRPDLSNRSLRFSSRDLTESQVLELCRKGTIAFIGREDIEAAGFVSEEMRPSRRFDRFEAIGRAGKCKVA